MSDRSAFGSWPWHAVSLVALGPLVAVGIVGCSRTTGPERFDYSGEVSFGGKAVAVGYLSFEPDDAAGNSGPGAMAEIVGGRYQTEPGRGPVGGPHRVLIVGFDGKSPDGLGDGRPLFPEVVCEVDLPRQDGSQSFSIAGEKPYAVTAR